MERASTPPGKSPKAKSSAQVSRSTAVTMPQAKGRVKKRRRTTDMPYTHYPPGPPSQLAITPDTSRTPIPRRDVPSEDGQKACSSSGKWYLDAPPDWLYPNPHRRPDARLTDDDNINLPPEQGLQEHDLHLLDRRDQTHLTTDDTTDKGKAWVSVRTTHKYTHTTLTRTPPGREDRYRGRQERYN